MKKLCMLLLTMLMISGCSPNFNTDSLLSPPKLTEEQIKLSKALESAVGTNTFKLKYPRRGNFMSAFILEDLNYDDVYEAVAFYELTVAGNTSTWMSILVQEGEQWRSIVQIPGINSEIDFVSFSPITQLDKKNIIVGWSASKRDDMTTSVYLFNNNQIATMFTESYDEVITADVDNNGLHEMMFFSKNNTLKPPGIRLSKFRAGKISIISEVMLPTSTEGFTNVGYGAFSKGLNGIFADVILDKGQTTTILATIERSALTELFAEDFGLFSGFERKAPSLSVADMNNDKYLDIPQNEFLPGYKNSGELDKLYLTKFYSIIGGSMLPTTICIANHKAGYMLTIPEIWEDNVTVIVQADTNEWHFVVYNDSLMQSEIELLRIKTIGPGDYADVFDTTNYHNMATKGNTTYLAYIPNETYEGLSINYDQLKTMFKLI